MSTSGGVDRVGDVGGDGQPVGAAGPVAFEGGVGADEDSDVRPVHPFWDVVEVEVAALGCRGSGWWH